MRDQNAQQLLAKVMNWQDEETVRRQVPALQLLADYKYDDYQRFGPGKRFMESLALWLNQFVIPADRQVAFDFVTQRLVYFSEREITHLVQTAYPDLIVQERLRMVAEERGIPDHRVGSLVRDPRFEELRLKTLYLGLSDGARTNELRRASDGEISNEQIWHAYELGDDKAQDMIKELGDALAKANLQSVKPCFNQIWLLDDFSGSGNTYIRVDDRKYKGKIKKIYERLAQGDLVSTDHYEVFLLLYVATQKAVDHIEYWAERFTSEKGYKPLQVRVTCLVDHDVAVDRDWSDELKRLIEAPAHYDSRVFDKHFAVGGTLDARLGFGGCALPLVLSHNTPNNSLYILWGPELSNFFGLFPRISRHREF